MTGAFTGLDSYAGAAIDPLSMNRFLYAEANPATFVDPDGHCLRYIDDICNDHRNDATQQQAAAAQHAASVEARDDAIERDYGTSRRSGGAAAPPTSTAHDNWANDIAAGLWPDDALMSRVMQQAADVRSAMNAREIGQVGWAFAQGLLSGLAAGLLIGAACAVTAGIACAVIGAAALTASAASLVADHGLTIGGVHLGGNRGYSASDYAGLIGGAIGGGIGGGVGFRGVTGPLGIGGPLGAPALGEFTSLRATELQGQLPGPSAGRVTMGVGRVVDASGSEMTIISTSEPRGYLRPGVTLKPGEAVVPGFGHAETNLIDWARANNMRLLEVGAGRPMCPSCSEAVWASGAATLTPRR